MIQVLNDSRSEKIARVVVVGNVLAALLSGGSAVLTRVNPALLTGGEVTDTVTFYAEAYLARALPISAVLIGLLATRRAAGLLPVLLLAGLAQVGDAIIGARHGQPGMVAGSLVGATIHLGSAWLLGRGRRVTVSGPAAPR